MSDVRYTSGYELVVSGSATPSKICLAIKDWGTGRVTLAAVHEPCMAQWLYKSLMVNTIQCASCGHEVLNPTNPEELDTDVDIYGPDEFTNGQIVRWVSKWTSWEKEDLGVSIDV